MVKNFVIPLVADDLLKSHGDQYLVEKIVPLQKISQALHATLPVLQANSSHFILEHFDTFFSVIVHDNKVGLTEVLDSFTMISKAVKTLVNDLEKIFDHNNDITEEDRKTYLCINNMLAYLFSWFICHIDQRVTKNANNCKKGTRTVIEEDWERCKQKALELLYRWLQIPLYKIWSPQIVENSFVATLAQICYKILEQSKDAKQKHMRQTIFRILGTLIKRYNHGIVCIARIIQLIKLCDSIAVPLADGIVYMATECDCTGLIKGIMNEIEQSEIGEAESRNISMFLENIAISQPDLIIPILDKMIDYLSNEFYTIRNCVIGILGNVVQKALTGENLTNEQKEQRDKCLNALEEHILDCNIHVRSKVLQTCQHLCRNGAVPLARYGKLLTASTLRLQDKSTIVCRQALQLLCTMLQNNPFAAKLTSVPLMDSLEKEKAKLQRLQTEIARTSKGGHEQRYELWDILQPDIRTTIKMIVENEKDYINDSGTENEEYFHTDEAFEHIRQLLLNREIIEAVKCIWKYCIVIKEIIDLKRLSSARKEEHLFLLLHKTFIESESESMDERNIGSKLEEENKKKKEINTRKRVIEFFTRRLEFAVEMEKAIPMAEELLFSPYAGVAIESCKFLGIGFQFKVTGADSSIYKALFQIFHCDQSVRNNACVVFKNIYLDIGNDEQSAHKIAIIRANRLINLMKGLEAGQSPPLAHLIQMWYKNGELNSELLQVLWKKFSMNYPNTSQIDSKAALMVITMIAQAEPNIVIDNLDVLVKVGLGPRAKDDLFLAQDTCKILLKIKQNSEDIKKAPLRYSNNHDMFQQIQILLTDTFVSANENAYICFATDAINVIYHLACQPDKLMEELLLNVTEKHLVIHQETNEIDVPYHVVCKLLHLVGHTAINQMCHLDISIYKELKRRNAAQKQNKGKKQEQRNSLATSNIRSKSASASISLSVRHNSEHSIISTTSNDSAMDDVDAELVHNALENEIVTGDGLLTIYIPLILNICKHPDKYDNENLQAASSLALSKMMTVSSVFCEQHVQLLVTILEQSLYPVVRSNILIGLSDLITRFPYQMGPQSKHIFGRLRDRDVNVRRTCVQVLSNLIMREMIRVKGQVSELALCINDEDEQVQQLTKEFFNQLAQKGSLYNIVPDILSRLVDPELNLEEKQFQETIKYIFGLLQKERQIDTIIDKICTRFKLATTERQWRDFSYCLSLLQFSRKSIQLLIESLPLLKEKLQYEPVLTALQNIIEQTKKKADATAACKELEQKLQQLLQIETEIENSELADQRKMPSPSAIPKNKKKHRLKKKKKIHYSSDEDD